MNRSVFRGLGIAFIIWGAVILLSSYVGITGFTIVDDVGLQARSILGLVFILVGILLFTTMRAAPSRLETTIEHAPIHITSSVKQDPTIYRLAQDLKGKERIQHEINHLMKELSKGNENPGAGTDHLNDAGPVWYLRGRNGSRVFYIKHDEGYEVVGYADKTTEDRVINRLRNLYGQRAKERSKRVA